MKVELRLYLTVSLYHRSFITANPHMSTQHEAHDIQNGNYNLKRIFCYCLLVSTGFLFLDRNSKSIAIAISISRFVSIHHRMTIFTAFSVAVVAIIFSMKITTTRKKEQITMEIVNRMKNKTHAQMVLILAVDKNQKHNCSHKLFNGELKCGSLSLSLAECLCFFSSLCTLFALVLNYS